MAKSFKETIARRQAELGLTYEDLARQVGVSGVYIGKILQGKVVPSDEVIYRLSRALDLDLEALVISAHLEKAPDEVKPVFERLSRHAPGEFLGGIAGYDNIEPHQLGPGRPAPVVGLVRAGEFTPSEDGGYPPGAADNYVYTDRKGRNLFAVTVTNDSMEPRFHEGDVLIVNPNLEAGNGDYVIAKLRDENEATFKKLVVHGPGKKGESLIILRPLNPSYQDMVITEPGGVEIIGKVVERKTLF